MRNVNHKEDFALPLTLRDSAGRPLRVPPYDFTVRLHAGTSEYFAGRFEGRLMNCRPSKHDQCTLVIFVSDHRLIPCRELMAEIIYYVPDSEYSDSVRRIVRTQPTGICLTVKCSDLPGHADFDAMPTHECDCDTISRNEIDDLWLRISAPRRDHHRLPPPDDHHCGCHAHCADGREAEDPEADEEPEHSCGCDHHYRPPMRQPMRPAHHEPISPHDIDCMTQAMRRRFVAGDI